MVIPRSRSMSMRSRYCARIARASTMPVIWSMRSASVDLPWSMWAMMQKFRIASGGVACGCSAVRARGDTSGWFPCVEAVRVLRRSLPRCPGAGTEGPGHGHGELELGVHSEPLARVGPAAGALADHPAPGEVLHVEGDLLATGEGGARGEHDERLVGSEAVRVDRVGPALAQP